MDWGFNFLQTIGIKKYADLRCQTLGLDSPENCLDFYHYQQYPEDIDYAFNEIGFRTRNVNEFQGDEILAIGDSFTLGMGVNYHQTWPSQLEQILNYPVLNFSLNGASNDWMVRKTQQLLTWFKPKALVVHYSFSHRRERPHKDWTDDERTECEPFYTSDENFQNWRKAFDYFHGLDMPVVHSFIPDWHDQPIDYTQLPGSVIPPLGYSDRARDVLHYGPVTNQLLAREIAKFLA